MSKDAGPSNYFANMAPSPVAAPAPAYTPGSALPFAPPMPPPSAGSYMFNQGPSQGNKRPRDTPRRGMGRGRGRGARSNLAFDRTVSLPSTGLRRTTRQSTQAQKFGDASGRKVKLRLGGTLKGKARAGYMLETPFGWYDRGLDEDKEEPSVYEEQFILRVNKEILHGDPSKGIKGLREAVLSRKAIEGVSIKWKDDRRATFTHGDKLYAAKMVDLPCIIESQKIMDNKRLFKVADISQMLVVGDILQSEEQLDQLPKPTPEEVTWPDGLTAVMRNVRQERWRQKIDLGSDATVVDAVERLMRLDASALSVSNKLVSAASLQVRSSVEPQQSAAMPHDDYAFGLAAPSPAASTPAGSHGREHRAGTSGRESFAGDDADAEGDYRMREPTVDQEQDIVKRFNERMQRDTEGQAEGQGGDHDDLFGESEEEEEEEDVDEVSDAEEDETAGLDKEDQELIKQQNKLAGEINDLEEAVKRKRVEVQGKQNRTLRERANIQLQKMIKELDSKRAEHDQVVSRRSNRQEKSAIPDASADPPAEAKDTDKADKVDDNPAEDEDDEDSLFGDSDHEEDEVAVQADDDEDAEGEEDSDAMAAAVAQSAAVHTAIGTAASEAQSQAVTATALVVKEASSPDVHMSSPAAEGGAAATPTPVAPTLASEAQSIPMAKSTSQAEPTAVFDYEFSEPSGSDDDD